MENNEGNVIASLLPKGSHKKNYEILDIVQNSETPPQAGMDTKSMDA